MGVKEAVEHVAGRIKTVARAVGENMSSTDESDLRDDLKWPFRVADAAASEKERDYLKALSQIWPR